MRTWKRTVRGFRGLVSGDQALILEGLQRCQRCLPTGGGQCGQHQRRSDATSASPIIQTLPLGAQWPCIHPFLFCAHHNDAYPAGDGQMGVQAVELQDRPMGSDFSGKDGFSMYHGDHVPGFPGHPHRGF